MAHGSGLHSLQGKTQMPQICSHLAKGLPVLTKGIKLTSVADCVPAPCQDAAHYAKPFHFICKLMSTEEEVQSSNIHEDLSCCLGITDEIGTLWEVFKHRLQSLGSGCTDAATLDCVTWQEP